MRPTIKKPSLQVQDAPDDIIIDQTAALSKLLSSFTSMGSLHETLRQAGFLCDGPALSAEHAAQGVIAEP